MTMRVQDYLQEELLKRIKNNPRYSLRSFAQALGMNSGSLSRIISGKVKPSKRTLILISERLGVSPDRLSRPDPGKSAQTRAHRTLQADLFKAIADWYHYAILELTSLKGFKPDHRWIAMRLGISVTEVNVAVERLIRLQFLEIQTDGKWVDRSGDVTTVGNEFTTAAFRKLQHQVLEMGQKALDQVPFELRDQTSIMFAVDAKRIPEIKTKIKAFRRELARHSEEAENKTELYQLGIAFYPLTKQLKFEEKK